jgi:predicted esterase
MPKLHETTGTARFGSPLVQARGAVILVHGRGSSPHDIAGLADVIPGAGLAFLAPAATGGTWYPQRFLAPLERNEPWLSSALNVIDRLVAEVLAAGLAAERIGLAGFSQGACLVLEYAARHPRRYGFVAGLSGALIGPPDTPRPAGDLQRTQRPASNLHGTPVTAGLRGIGRAHSARLRRAERGNIFPAQRGRDEADFSRRHARHFPGRSGVVEAARPDGRLTRIAQCIRVRLGRKVL